MNSFVKVNKSLISFFLVITLIIPIFGFKFFINIVSNALLLIVLIPILLFLIIFIGINSYKSKIKACNNCGAISLGINDKCMNCGLELNDINDQNKSNMNASERTIEIKAEEIK